MDKGQLRSQAREILDGVAESTAAEYRRASDRLQGQHWRDYAADRGLGRRSAAVLKAGWRHEKAREILDGLKQSDRAKRAGDGEASRLARQAAEQAAADLDADASAPHYEPPEGEQRGAGSKRRRLPKTESWQKQVMDELKSSDDKLKALTLSATGCRPSELERGVTLSRGPDGEVVALIWGSKCSDKTGGGQEWRELTLPDDNPQTGVLGRWLDNQGGKAKVSGCPGKFRKRLARAGERAGWRGISPYSFRHQWASDEKATSNDDELSAALGHVSPRSKQNYGHARQARGRGGVRARAAQEVRQSPAPAPSQGPAPG